MAANESMISLVQHRRCQVLWPSLQNPRLVVAMSQQMKQMMLNQQLSLSKLLKLLSAMHSHRNLQLSQKLPRDLLQGLLIHRHSRVHTSPCTVVRVVASRSVSSRLALGKLIWRSNSWRCNRFWVRLNVLIESQSLSFLNLYWDTCI